MYRAGSPEGVATGAGLQAVCSAWLGMPFLLAAVAMPQFLAFVKKARRHLDFVEKDMRAMLVITGVMFR